MKIDVRLSRKLLQDVFADLARPHPFASERVGFLACKLAEIKPRSVLVLPSRYLKVEDEDYLNDAGVGAMMGPAAIRKALQFAYNNNVAVFHVHMHDHYGRPWFSDIDLRETNNFIPDFWHVRPTFPHGALILSRNSLSGLCWMPGRKKPLRVSGFNIVGFPTTLIRE
jgi:hypothetical protein